MERRVVVRGRLHGRQIELDRPVEDLDGEVEVTVRRVEGPSGTVADILALIAGFPPGSRSRNEIEQEIAAARESWDRNGKRR